MYVDVLAARKTVGKITGKILFAGRNASKQFLQRYTGYVEQFGRLRAEVDTSFFRLWCILAVR